MQVYTVAIYIEIDPANAKLKQLKQQGFFKSKSPDLVCEIINQPGFKKFLHIKLLRDVSTGRFISEMSKDLVGLSASMFTLLSEQNLGEAIGAGRWEELICSSSSGLSAILQLPGVGLPSPSGTSD